MQLSEKKRERDSRIMCGGGKSSNSDEEKQLSLVDLILSVLPTCRICDCGEDEEEEDEVISAVHGVEIGWPTNVKHITHVTFDRFHGFLGLPLEFEVEIPCKAPAASVSVCGVSADSLKWSYDARCNSVPTILLLMQEKLYALGGLKAEGIFRINPENSQDGYVREHLNRGIVPDEIDIHCLAGLIKAWFRELPSGVLDGLSPEQVLQCDAEEDCVELVKQLRETESCLLAWAVDLMADIVELEEWNKMSARNIAMVFAPNMTKVTDPLTALMHAVQVTSLLEMLITRRIRERSTFRKKHKRYDDLDEMASDDEELLQYSPTNEDKSDSESLSDIEYCFSKQLDEHENANDGFRKQLEGILLCRDQPSPINGSTLHTGSGVSFPYRRTGSPSTSTSEDEASRSRSRSVAKKRRLYRH